jgi:UDP-N-acetylmuramyl pentapeptide phosphotransferase/UDP-N-acetylglucosamine-1-phosphate transferase
VTQSGDAVVWLIEFGGILFLVTGGITFILLLWLKPALSRYALSRPNARSSHKVPTPQGAGIAVITATTIVFGTAAIFFPALEIEPWRLATVFISVIALAIVGITDDIRPIEAMPRLLLQAAAVAVVLTTLPADLRVFTALPLWIERALMFGAVLWFVNLVNFMDGIDWMTAAEVVPVTLGLALFGLSGALPPAATLVAFGLCGAVIGFAPFNRPTAQMFLGDVGSLPIGLMLGWLLILLAGRGYLAAAILLPLYYLCDGTVTLLRRLARGEQITQAHRSHFYQRAMDNGFSVYQIVGKVFAINVALVGLATITLVRRSAIIDGFSVLFGIVLVVSLLWNFAQRSGSRS